MVVRQLLGWLGDRLVTCTHHNGRGCSLGLFGGRPSAGVCARCDRYDGPVRGLGDVVEAVTKATDIKRMVQATVKGCNCGERRARLNRAVPFRQDR